MRGTIVIISTIQIVLFHTVTIYGVSGEERYVYRLLYSICAFLYLLSYYQTSFTPISEIPELNSIAEDQY